MSKNQDVPDRSRVTVVGGGIAGAWLAYRLAQRGVRTVLVSADEHSPPLSRQWSPGLVNRRVLDCTSDPDTAPQVFADSSTTGDPAYPPMMLERAAKEFGELSRMVEYTPLGPYLRPHDPVPGIHLGAGDGVVRAVLDRFEALGGRRVSGRVTELVMDGDLCLGLRYEHEGRPHRIRCGDLVLASGGFCGLFADGVGTNTGYLLGTYARHGGELANLELFNRFALGNLDRKTPLYPFDLEDARLLRAGEPATELTKALDRYTGDRCEVDVFAHYWTANFDVPHTVESPRGSTRLGPVRGFAMGGMANPRPGAAPRNVHAVGECAYGLSQDSLSGKPFISFLVRAGLLADELGEREDGTDFATGGPVPGPDLSLRNEVRVRLHAFQDNRFTASAAEEFARWCRDERARRRARRADSEDLDLLVLAEACARSTLAREESRGFFFRPDFPGTDAELDGRVTLARYDETEDRVRVALVPTETRTGT
ncbi:FAD-dependent oxidoreductase [Amycolatopsis nigrescens]|uniref:FAD-dependent oxidoreductase n=1 Tax=Amycolatopsis nigrescens TaxID=381445 RepID=UPI000380C740|nr:FAD-binding protein [Amycolatopsis nigrescens]